MKHSNILKITVALFAVSLLSVACSDNNGSTPFEANVKKKEDPQTVKFYKVVLGNDCRNYILVENISPEQAEEGQVDSAMGFCEERVKPQKSSANSNPKVAYACIRANQLTDIFNKFNICKDLTRVGDPTGINSGPNLSR